MKKIMFVFLLLTGNVLAHEMVNEVITASASTAAAACNRAQSIAKNNSMQPGSCKCESRPNGYICRVPALRQKPEESGVDTIKRNMPGSILCQPNDTNCKRRHGKNVGTGVRD